MLTPCSLLSRCHQCEAQTTAAGPSMYADALWVRRWWALGNIAVQHWPQSTLGRLTPAHPPAARAGSCPPAAPGSRHPGARRCAAACAHWAAPAQTGRWRCAPRQHLRTPATPRAPWNAAWSRAAQQLRCRAFVSKRQLSVRALLRKQCNAAPHANLPTACRHAHRGLRAVGLLLLGQVVQQPLQRVLVALQVAVVQLAACRVAREGAAGSCLVLLHCAAGPCSAEAGPAAGAVHMWPCRRPQPAPAPTLVLAPQRGVPVVLHRVVGAAGQQLGDDCRKAGTWMAWTFKQRAGPRTAPWGRGGMPAAAGQQ